MNGNRTARSRAGGFTFVELIVTLILVGILAFVAVPRLSLLGGFETTGFADQLQSLLRYAQKSAIAQRRNVAVSYATNAASICSYTGATTPCNANCAGATGVSPLDLPGGRFRPAGAGTGVAAGTLCFDATGRPYQGGGALPASVSIAVTENATVLRSVVVEPETGYVH